jgi:N-acetylglucosamine-6-phosphate deacetylase
VPGYEADIVVFSKDFEIIASMVGGKFIRNELG